MVSSSVVEEEYLVRTLYVPCCTFSFFHLVTTGWILTLPAFFSEHVPGLAWFSSVYLVTRLVFVADQFKEKSERI